MHADEKLVVVVEDDVIMQRVLTRVLRWRKYTPLVFSSVAPAVAAVLERRPCAVLVDYDLGDASTGADVARAIAGALGPDAPPTLLVSALADRVPSAERDLFAAMHGKPFRASELLDDLDRAVSSDRKRSGVRAISVSVAKRRAENE